MKKTSFGQSPGHFIIIQNYHLQNRSITRKAGHSPTICHQDGIKPNLSLHLPHPVKAVSFLLYVILSLPHLSGPNG